MAGTQALWPFDEYCGGCLPQNVIQFCGEGLPRELAKTEVHGSVEESSFGSGPSGSRRTFAPMGLISDLLPRTVRLPLEIWHVL